MIAAPKGFIKWAGLMLAVSLPLVATQAHAVTVTVGDTVYELSSVSTSYDASPELLQSQTWWGDASLAFDFANAFAATGSSPLGISMFAYGFTEKDPDDEYSESQVGVYYTLTDSSAVLVQNGSIGSYQGWDFVTATRSASSVPEINAGALSQALLILFALWLVTWRRPASRVA